MLHIKLIGTPVLQSDDRKTLSLGRRALSILAFIVCHAQPRINREVVASAVWPDHNEERARGNLRRELHYIRALHPELAASVIPGRIQLEFRPTAALTVDILQFKDGCTQLFSAQTLEEQVLAGQETFKLLDQEFLSGIHDEWVIVYRREFEAELLRFTDKLIETLRSSRLFNDAERVLDTQLSINPLREQGYLQKITLQAQSGNVAQALDTYRKCEQLFIDEMGVKPSSELRQQYAMLMLQVTRDEKSQSEATAGHSIVDQGPLIIATPPHGVGRSRELLSITETITSNQSPGLFAVLIQGDSGIGKSHLLSAASNIIGEHGFRCVHARCSEYQRYQPFSAIGQLVSQFDHATLRERLSSTLLLELTHAFPEFLSDLNSQSKKAVQRSRSRLFIALDTLFADNISPIALAFDDIQWLDPDSEEWLLAFCQKQISGTRIVLLLSERNLDEKQQSFSQNMKDHLKEEKYLEFRLSPLSSIDTELLYRSVSDSIGVKIGTESTQRAIATADENASVYQLTLGIPLLILELAQHTVSQNSRESRQNLAVPTAIDKLVTHRLAGLPPAVNSVLEVIAVANRPFSLKLIRMVSGFSGRELLEALEELWSNNLLHVTETGDYALSHLFYQQIVLRGISTSRRSLLHGQLAEFYQSEVESGYLTAVGEVAHHHLAAGDPVAAFSWFKTAAEHAENSMAHRDAIAYCKQAKQLLQQLGGRNLLAEEEINVLLIEVRNASILEGYASPKVKQLCEQLINRRHQEKLSPKLSHEINKQTRILYTFGNKPRKARSMGILQISDATACDDHLKIIEAWRCKGVAEFQIGRFTDCEVSMTKAIDLANQCIGDGRIAEDRVPFFVPVACNFLSLMQYIQGRSLESEKSLTLGLSYPGKHVDIFSRYLLLITQANAYQLMGQKEKVKDLGLQLQTLAIEYNLHKISCIASYFLGWVNASEGNGHEGLSQISIAIETFPKTADHHLFPFWWTYRADLEYEMGLLEQAYTSVRAGIAASRYTRQGAWVAEQYRLMAVVKRALGHDKADYERLFNLSLRIADKQHAQLFVQRCRADMNCSNTINL